MVRHSRRILVIALTVLFAVGIAVCIIEPLPKTAEAEECYFCRWEDGTVSEETYASAYPDFADCFEHTIRLQRGGQYGEIETTERYDTVYRTMLTGGLAELLALSTAGINRLEQLALWRVSRGCIWYSSGYFVWEEDGLAEVRFATGEKLILLSGTISARRLQRTGATCLELRAEAEINSKTLVGTSVETVTACAPYVSEGGAVYLNTGTAVRLVAAVPSVTSLTVRKIDYADEGALLAAQNLQSVTLPFAGNASSPVGHNYRGEFAYLFSDGSQYLVPASLKSVKITGGALVSHAFYRCSSVEEIDLCGMNAEAIHADAFVDCTGLKRLHTPNAKVTLRGAYTSQRLPCGCTLFIRK